MIDTGAMGNFMDIRFARRELKTLVTKKQPYRLNAIDDRPAGDDGWVRQETQMLHMSVLTGEHNESIKFDLVKLGGVEVILGSSWMRRHNPDVNWTTGEILSMRCNCDNGSAELGSRIMGCAPYSELESDSNDSPPVATSIEDTPETDDVSKTIPVQYEEFANMFEDAHDESALPKHQPWDHEIPLLEGKAPPFEPLRRYNEEDLRTLREWSERMLKQGKIRPSVSSAGAPIHVAKNPGKKPRPCGDYRGLNAITVKNRYPLPRIDDMFDRIRKAKIFTLLDQRGSFNLIRIKEGEEWKTAFRLPWGLFEFTVMQFGLTNAPATGQQFNNDALREFLDRFAQVYLDDTLIYSETEEEHEQQVKQVLTAYRKRGVKLNPEKCHWHVKEVKFLGHIIRPGQILVDPGKIKEVIVWGTPTCKKHIQQFLGFCNYCRRFIRNYVTKSILLSDLLKDLVKFEWTSER